MVKYLWSTGVTLGAVSIVAYGIYSKQYVLPADIGTTYIVFIVALCMLFYLEGLMIGTYI